MLRHREIGTSLNKYCLIVALGSRILESFTAPRKWTCDTWASNSSAPSTFSATLIESFTKE
jgi:hypothetical protein